MSLSAVEPAVGQPDLKSLFESAADDGTEVLKDAPLGEKTTLRAGGAADWYAEPNTIEGLAALVRVCREHNLPVTVLGLGSNFLVLDNGVRGLTVRLCGEPFVAIETDGEHIRCGAGARMKKVATEARRSCLAGMEFLEGIPGSIGGGLRMNAGAMGSEMVEIVEGVSFMDKAGEVFEMAGSDIEFSYRSCPLLKNQIALGAVLRGCPDSAEAIAERMAAYSQKRWDSQPAARSAGCIFKNPEAIPAGKLIDELGLKRTSEGGAMVSEEHGNFIINKGGATAADFLKLIDRIRQRVLDERGIVLKTEVQIIGKTVEHD